jgi:hypothetical protein
VHQLQRRLRVPRWVDVVYSCRSEVSWWHVQRARRDEVHQLQRWLLLRSWLCESACCNMPGRHLQLLWRCVVQRLRCGLPVCRLGIDDSVSKRMPCWPVQCCWRRVVQQLQRRLRMPCPINVGVAISGSVRCRHLQRGWRDVLQQL